MKRNTTMTRKLLLPLLAATALCSLAAPAFAGSYVSGLTDTLTASPTHFAGVCPGVITFHGVVHVTGKFVAGSPVEIGYQFTRNDGGTGQNKFFNATHPGAYDITETWTLGGAQVPSFVGWEKYKAWVTDSALGGGHGVTWSNEAHFSLKCETRRK
jgi:hypothetical protein